VVSWTPSIALVPTANQLNLLPMLATNNTKQIQQIPTLSAPTKERRSLNFSSDDEREISMKRFKNSSLQTPVLLLLQRSTHTLFLSLPLLSTQQYLEYLFLQPQLRQALTSTAESSSTFFYLFFYFLFKRKLLRTFKTNTTKEIL
jgi:hypothetical protein